MRLCQIESQFFYLKDAVRTKPKEGAKVQRLGEIPSLVLLGIWFEHARKTALYTPIHKILAGKFKEYTQARKSRA